MNSNLQPIGIIGGAGPMASLLLHRLIIESAINDYGCKKNSDFPEIVHVSYPFNNHTPSMTNEERALHAQSTQKQLYDCLEKLRTLNIRLAGIACNSLHAYLTPSLLRDICLISLVDATKSELENHKVNNVLVFCTATSRANNLYTRVANEAIYPSESDQEKVDAAITRIISGHLSEDDASFFSACIAEAASRGRIDAVLLGCTEISELHNKYGIHSNVPVVDPLTILARKICEASFLAKVASSTKKNEDGP